MQKVLVIPDMQVPFHDARSLAAVEKYMADERWDRIVYIGDFMDFPQVSRFAAELPEELSKSLAADYKAGNAILDRHQRLLKAKNRKVKTDFLLGNHDIRPELFAAKHPQIKGLIEVEHGLRLHERGFNVVRAYPDGDVLKVGKVYFTHGLYTSSNHAKKHVDNFGVNILYGHTHDVQSHSKVLWGKNRTVIGQSLGCLCRYDLSYVGKNPTNWQQAVTTIFIKDDGHFNHYVSKIFNHSFTAPNGKTYSA